MRPPATTRRKTPATPDDNRAAPRAVVHALDNRSQLNIYKFALNRMEIQQ